MQHIPGFGRMFVRAIAYGDSLEYLARSDQYMELLLILS